MKSVITTFIISILLFSIAPKNFAQTPLVAWQDMFDGGVSSSPGAAANSIVPAIGGGYIVCGYHTSISDPGAIGGSADAWVVVYDEEGSMLWKKAYGGSGSEAFSAVRQTIDGTGYIFTGRTNSTDGHVSGNHGSTDIWVVRTDDTGAVLWQKCYGGTGVDGLFSISDGRTNGRTALLETLPDGGYIIAAPVVSNDGDVTGNHGGRDVWLARLDDTGAIQWSNTFGGAANDYCSGNLYQTADGGFIFGGGTESTDGDITSNNGLGDFWIVKTDSLGTLDWQKTLGGSGMERGIAGICPAPDGGYIMAGTSQSADGDVNPLPGGTAYQNWWVVKVNDTGTIVWNSSFGNVGQYTNDLAYTIKPAINGGYLIGGNVAGATISAVDIGEDATVAGPIGYGEDFWLLKINEEGELLWEQNYYTDTTLESATALEHIRDIYQNEDGSIMAVGGLDNYSKWWTAKLFACPAYAYLADTICKGDTYVFNDMSLSIAGAYTDTLLMTVTGCDSLVQLTLYVDSVGATPVIEVTDDVLSTGTYEAYQWLDETGTAIPGADEASFEPAVSGTYRVVAYNGRGCSDTSAAYNYSVSGLDDPAAFKLLQLYPNPANELLNIHLPGWKEPALITITTAEGRLIQQCSYKGGILSLPTLSWPTGILFVRISTSEAAVTRKIVKQE